VAVEAVEVGRQAATTGGSETETMVTTVVAVTVEEMAEAISCRTTPSR
jgi:hypothetical protein